MSLITGDGTTYPASFEAPDDGDDRDAVAHLVGLEALADRTEYLKDRVVDGAQPINTSALTVAGDATIGDDLTVTGDLTVVGNVLGGLDVTGGIVTVDGDIEATGGLAVAVDVEAAGYYLPAARSVEVVVDAPAEADDGWIVARSTNDFYWETTTVLQHRLRVCLNALIPRGASIVSLVARFQGAGGHTALPTFMPQLILYRKRVGTSGAASGTVDSVNDTSADTTAFQAEHDITLTLGSPHTATVNTHSYYAVLVSEADGGLGDAVSGALFQGLKLTYTYSRVDKT
jgi:hypothetical protein